MTGWTVTPYGEGASFVDLGLDAALPADRAAHTLAAADALRAAFPAADVVSGAGTLLVIGAGPDDVAKIRRAPLATAPPPGRSHLVEAVYDGPDLDEIAALSRMHRDDVVAAHSNAEYVAELVGFLPGFAYLAPLGEWPLAVPRRPSPRPAVPAGSIGLAASFTAIYPLTSPGGWNLVARAVNVAPFDPSRDPPILFRPGDRVRFVPVPAPTPAPVSASTTAPLPVSAVAPARGLVVLAAPACATIQDRGRPGQLGRGLPPSGPLDPETHAAANAAAGNPKDAAAIEVPLGSLEVQAIGGAVVSIDGEPSIALSDGERLRVPASDRAVRYLAVRGGVDVPAALGARATLLVARLGGLGGRALRKRDVVPIGDLAWGEGRIQPVDRGERDPLDVDPGPHLARFPAEALDALLATEWRVSRLGDRVGVRLEGGKIPRDRPDYALPVPMVRGAVEVSTDGTPIVLGPDHPTTGGYPVLAVLRRGAQARLARRKPGDVVRFRLGG